MNVLDSETSAEPAASSSLRILPLQPEDVAQIKSSINITELEDAILGLLCNALDAEATKIEIDVQADRGSCTVTDNGLGIPEHEFLEDGGLLKVYCE
jgi:DNA mismatch repair protein MLH3